jgi:L-threonylcarbamoyladenylate synthase
VPERLGLRVPELTGALAPLAAARWPVLQSSANPSGEADARRLEDVDDRVRAAVDLQLDGGELPGTPSSVVDLGSYEETGEWRLLREGAVPPGEIEPHL